MLLATIRDMGACPCPRCFVAKEDIWKMGMKLDMRQREQHLRVDDEARRRIVGLAHTLVYDPIKNYNPTSAGIERLLQPRSWVPTEASRR